MNMQESIKNPKKAPKLSKEQWAWAEENCTLFSSVKMNVDGKYLLSLTEQRTKNKIVIALYVNGQVKGAWFLCKPDEEPAPELKYFPVKEEYMYKRSTREGLRLMGRKDYDAKFKCSEMCFTSFAQARRHLENVCESIELITY